MLNLIEYDVFLKDNVTSRNCDLRHRRRILIHNDRVKARLFQGG